MSILLILKSCQTRRLEIRIHKILLRARRPGVHPARSFVGSPVAALGRTRLQRPASRRRSR